MLERLHHSDGLGAIYPPMMYSVMALDVLGLRQGPSGARGSPAPVQQPDGGRRRALLLPAVLFAGVGHRHRRRMRWARAMPSTRRCAARADWLLAQGSPAQGRLVGQAAQYRALRLGFRIRQRVLSRYRRHRHGDAGAEPGAPAPTRRRSRPASGARSTGCWPCSRATAAGRPSTSTTTGSS